MATINVGLNGFGRIGRVFARISLDRQSFNIVAVNTGSSSPEMLAYLLKYDSVYRTLPNEVKAKNNEIEVDGHSIRCYNIRDPKDIPWDHHKVDIVVDCTGVFKTSESLRGHLNSKSVKKVVLSAPAKDEGTSHLVLGVNDKTFDFKRETIISNCSCTTNCAAPMFQVLHENFRIKSGFLTTMHAFTSSQQLLDSSAKEFTRARAATLSLIPTTTGAAKAVVKVLPELKDKIDALAIRAPVPVGSISDISAVVEKETSSEEVNQVFRKASEENLRGILAYEKAPLVSSDYIGSPYSCTFDANYTQVIGGNLVKIFGWYDNEWGYSARLVELVERLAQFI